MRILIITSEFPPVIGGAGMYAHDLAIGLSKNEVEVDIITYDNGSLFSRIKKKLENNKKIKVFSLKPLIGIHFIQFLFLIMKVLKERNYDKIILSDGRAKRTFALFNPLFRDKIEKTVSVFHGNEVNSFFKHPSLLIKVLNIDKKLINLFHNQSKLITVSKNEQEIWQNFLPSLTSKIRLVMHGVNEDIFYKRDECEINKIKKRLKVPFEKKIIITASRLVKEKGQDNLLLAFREILRHDQNSHLIILGNGDYMQTLKSISKALNIDDHVTFVGGISRDNIADYYSVADIFVLVSRFEESFGLVYIEAAGCGVPSIAGNLGGIKDVIIDGNNGFVVNSFNFKELEERLLALLENEPMRLKMALNANVMFKNNFTSEKAAKNLLKEIF